MDREAEFGRLYEAHRAAVHAYFAGRTGDRQLAADLMQEVFLRAWQHLDKVADLPEDGQRGWLFTVARNLSVDAARHQRTADGAQRALEERAVHPAGPGRRPRPAPRCWPPSGRASSRPRSRRCRSSSGSRSTMAAAGEMNSAEIGAALGVPAGTVRYRLSLARRTLAEALGDYDAAQEEEP